VGDERKRIQAVHERLQRWAVWHHTVRAGSARGLVSNWSELRVDCVMLGPETLISASDQEARETEEVIGGLRQSGDRDERRIAQVVIEVYRNREGRSLEQTAGVLKMSRGTLHSWLCLADSRIQLELWQRARLREEAGRRDASEAVLRKQAPVEID